MILYDVKLPVLHYVIVHRLFPKLLGLLCWSVSSSLFHVKWEGSMPTSENLVMWLKMHCTGAHVRYCNAIHVQTSNSRPWPSASISCLSACAYLVISFVDYWREEADNHGVNFFVHTNSWFLSCVFCILFWNVVYYTLLFDMVQRLYTATMERHRETKALQSLLKFWIRFYILYIR